MNAETTDDVGPGQGTKPRRRWRQFSLRTLLLVMFVLSVGLALFAWRLERAREQAAAVATIRRYGGEINYDFEVRAWIDNPSAVPRSRVPEWLLTRLGPDFFHNVGSVRLGPAALPKTTEEINRCWEAFSRLHSVHSVLAMRDWINADAIEAISRQTELRYLYLREGTLTARDLAAIGKLKQLESLELTGTGIGDEGTNHLSEFPLLHKLWLSDTRIGDEAIGHITRNVTLQHLFLNDTRISDQGAKEIAKLQSLKTLALSNTRITDVGVAELASLDELGRLEIRNTQVTGSGFRAFPASSRIKYIQMRDCPASDEGAVAIGRFRRLETLTLGGRETSSVTMRSLSRIEWTASLEDIQLTGSTLNDDGLMRFLELRRLRQIVVLGTKVTPEGVRQFQTARPTVNVVGP